MDKALIISRCSTKETKQDIKRQSDELSIKYNHLYNIIDIFEYYQSGTENDITNKHIIERAIRLGIDTILVSEVSRLSRKVLSALTFVEECSLNGINIHIDSHNLQTLNENKTENEVTKMMFVIGAQFAEMELKQTYRRLKSGRDRYVAKGGKLGRKIGYKIKDHELLEKYPTVVKELKLGLSIRKVAKISDVSIGQVHKIKKILEQK